MFTRSIFRHNAKEKAGCDYFTGEEDLQKGEATGRAATRDLAISIPGMLKSLYAVSSENHLGYSLTEPLIIAFRGAQGSDKTTLLQHILQSDHGLRIAVIVNDIGVTNVDASIIQSTHRIHKTEENIIALQNGCICCTLRQDLLSALVELSGKHDFDYVVIKSSGGESKI